jgi:type III secretion system FlhB-like substrate exporter
MQTAPSRPGDIRLHTLFNAYTATFILILALSGGCGDPVDRDIADLIAGGDGAEEARIALNLAKGTAVDPLIKAIRDEEHPVRARVLLVEALYRLRLREKIPAAYEGLVEGLADPTPEVRAACARALGNLGAREAIDDLLLTMERETDPGTQLEILKTFEMINLETTSANEAMDPGKVMDQDQTTRFIRALQAIDTAVDTLASAQQEWLENIAETMAVEARQRLLTGDLDGAEQGLRDALVLVPKSRNINLKLGKFYHQNGQSEKGFEFAARAGLTAYAAPLATAPTIDGELDDPGWDGVEPLTRLYQLLERMYPYPAQGRSEIYLGYRDQTLYIGVKGYEPRTDNLRAEKTQRDDNVWQDDCVEIYLDTNHDARTYYQLDVNSLGALDDISYSIEENRLSGGFDWNADIETGALVAKTFWSMELAVPIAEFNGSRVEPGTVWGFNVAQVRIANNSESAQWAPTYGWSQQPDRFGFLVFK